MDSQAFSELDAVMGSGGVAAGLKYAAERFRRERAFPLLFEARLMEARRKLGLPLIQTQDSDEYPADRRAAYEQAMVEAAREVGRGYLEEGNIPRAWPYLRAIGETDAVAAAIERASVGEDVDAVIAISLQEGANPAKGLELIHAQYGMCRAITSFGMYEVRKDRERCIGFLVREIHGEVARRLARAIGGEGETPEDASLPQLMEGRDWLFGEYDYYVDTSHLVSVLPYCLETRNLETLGKLGELCEYGKHLAPAFHSRGQAPFEDMYADYGAYIEALLSKDVEANLARFRAFLEDQDPAPAQVLTGLLVKLGRFSEAADISLRYLDGNGETGCPSAMQLFQMANNREKLKTLARERGDLLSYLAANGV